MLLAWTTVPERAAAEALAHSAVEQGLVVCVQIDGPVTSIYPWQGRVERASEYRLCFKFLPAQQARLEAHVLARHPYAVPEWIVVAADHVGEKYLSWARQTATPSSL